MKRVLSLMLTMVMILSMFTVMASADGIAKVFTDASSINYAEATDVMSAVHVIDGYPDGSFQPANTLTRGAAAKIICNMILGPDVASTLEKSATPFPDVPADHTFAGYVAYCAREGIINGYEDGNFRPAGTLTGYAFLKMLLGALGYDPKIEGYVGDGWTVSVAKRAAEVDLTKGVENFNGSNAVNREEACQYALNTFTATMVEYKKNQTVTIGSVEISNSSKAQPISRTSGKDYRGGVAEGPTGTLQFCEKHFSDLTFHGSGTDDYGRPQSEWHLKNETIGSYVDRSGLVATLKANASGITLQRVYSAIGSSIASQMARDYEDNKTFKKNAAMEVYVDGKLKWADETSYQKMHKTGLPVAKNTLEGLFEPQKILIDGSTQTISTKWITRSAKMDVFVEDDYNGSGKTRVALYVVNEALYKTTSDFNKSRGNITAQILSANVDGYPASITLKAEDFPDIEDLENDTYILVTWSLANNKATAVSEARKVTGAVNSYRMGATAVVDGSTYYWNGRDDCKEPGGDFASGGTEGSTRTNWQKNEFQSGRDVTLVLDSNGNIFWVEAANGSSSYVYVESIKQKTNVSKTASAAVYFTDGAYREVDVAKIVGSDGTEYTTWNEISAAGAKCPEKYWYTYAEETGGIVLRYISAKNGDTESVDTKQVAVVKSDLIINGSKVQPFATPSKLNTTINCNETTVLVMLNNTGKTDVYNGISQLPTLMAKAGATLQFATVVSGNTAKYVFLDYSALGTNYSLENAGAISDYVMIIQTQGNSTYISGGDHYEQVAAIVNGAQTTIKVATTSKGSEMDTGVLYKNVKPDNNGYYAQGTEVGTTGSAKEIGKRAATLENPVKYKDGVLTLDGNEYLTTKDTNIIYTITNRKNATARDLISNTGLSYEATIGATPQEVASSLEDMVALYNYYVILKEEGSTVIDTLYLNVYRASKASGDGATYEFLTEKLYKVKKGTGNEDDISADGAKTPAVWEIRKDSRSQYLLYVKCQLPKRAEAGSWQYKMTVKDSNDNVVCDSPKWLDINTYRPTNTGSMTVNLYGGFTSDAYADAFVEGKTYKVEVEFDMDKNETCDVYFRDNEVEVGEESPFDFGDVTMNVAPKTNAAGTSPALTTLKAAHNYLISFNCDLPYANLKFKLPKSEEPDVWYDWTYDITVTDNATGTLLCSNTDLDIDVDRPDGTATNADAYKVTLYGGLIDDADWVEGKSGTATVTVEFDMDGDGTNDVIYTDASVDYLCVAAVDNHHFKSGAKAHMVKKDELTSTVKAVKDFVGTTPSNYFIWIECNSLPTAAASVWRYDIVVRKTDGTEICSDSNVYINKTITNESTTVRLYALVLDDSFKDETVCSIDVSFDMNNNGVGDIFWHANTINITQGN